MGTQFRIGQYGQDRWYETNIPCYVLLTTAPEAPDTYYPPRQSEPDYKNHSSESVSIFTNLCKKNAAEPEQVTRPAQSTAGPANIKTWVNE